MGQQEEGYTFLHEGVHRTEHGDSKDKAACGQHQRRAGLQCNGVRRWERSAAAVGAGETRGTRNKN